jgi:tetratricopeptide (TPR) repeat protein
MKDTDGTPDKLQQLRARVNSAATPTERVKATMRLVKEVALTDPPAARPMLEQLAAEADAIRDRDVWGWCVSTLSDLLRRSGDLDGSMRYAELVVKHADAGGSREARACALNLVGLIHQERGEHGRAIECFEEFLRISREIGFGRGEQAALNQLACIHGVQGDLDRALAHYRKIQGT